MEFKEKMPLWENEGVEPPKSKRESGWTAGDKPPADWFNWLHNRTYKSLLELRENSSELKELIDNKASIEDLEEAIDKINQNIKDLDIEDEVHHVSGVEESYVVRDFENGITISPVANKSQFPSVNEFGVSITFINKLFGGYGQIVITSDGDTWTRRTNSLTSWGNWYSIKDEVGKKAGKEELSRSSTIVIANYDSHENSKKSADITIEEGENAATKINEAIQSLEGVGGEVKLMEGNYNLEYGIAVNVDGVHLTGIPKATVLVQNTNWKGNPYNNDRKNIIETWRESDPDSVNVEISNLYVKGAKVSSSYGFYCTGSSTVNNCIIENSGNDGFYCSNSSKITNCISENSSSYGFSCSGSSKITNCISENSGNDGFYCSGSSKITNCISENSSSDGFYCSNSSKITNCISENSSSDGFYCSNSSKITNCISENSSSDGFYCSPSFKGVAGHNTLIGDTLNDNSSSPAIVQYNIIQEGV